MTTRWLASLLFGYLLLGFFLLFLLQPLLLRWGREQSFPPLALFWIHLVPLGLLFLFLALYTFVLDREGCAPLFWGGGARTWRRAWRASLMGVVSGVISYPLVMAVSNLAGFVVFFIWKKEEVEQVAVTQIKMTMQHPSLFAAMVLLVVVMVPFMEELFFRGLFQNILKKWIGRGGAILGSALFFAFTHYFSSQGAGNVQVISSLFVLACFLGFIYERERSLWAPIVLHALFNATTVAQLFFR